MTSRDFCYWLQGFFEITTANSPTPSITPEQSKMIRNHLNLVFVHEIDPSMPDPTGNLQAIHDGVQLETSPIPNSIPLNPPVKIPVGGNRPSFPPYADGMRC